MKTFLYIAAACVLMAGCSTVGQGWRNFNAYYNTFYNTKQFYNEGYKSMSRQQPDIQPQYPIHIFYQPNNAGSDDFEQAIQRGSSILRDHENSKYVLPAVSIIGKSYFYRSEFFSALEKFRELQMFADENWVQEAVFWQGLTYFELGNYNEGIQFLENEIHVIEHPDRNLFAHIHALLGQLYAASQQWNMAAEHLQIAVEEAEEREIRARIYFLYGQVYEELEEYNQALYAFGRSGEISNNFNLEYNSLRKEAQSARRIQAYARAEAIYRDMLRNDKFFEYRNELRYEIGRTLQAAGQTDEALASYESVLGNRVQQTDPANRARTFFAMGEIYRDDLDNYAMAAAYFDSAATTGAGAGQLTPGFNAGEMADILGRYVSIKNEIAAIDSLLHLAEMTPDEFNEYVEELRQAEAQRIEEELREMQAQRNQMLVAEVQDTVIEAATSTEHGFLNIHNQVTLADASLQFQAIWGDRPIADNWRRRTDVSGTRFDQPVETEAADGTVVQMEADQETGIVPQIDVGDVPFSEEQKAESKTAREDAYYRLGNIFFLSLGQPDSAKVYFEKVAETGYNGQLRGMAYYSLAEISLLQQEENQAEFWYEQLKEHSPGSVFVNRLADRLDVESAQNDAISSNDDLVLHQYLQLEEKRKFQEPVAPREIADLAHISTDPEQRALLLFETAREYMKAARFYFTNESIISDWFERKQQEKSDRNSFYALRDSATVMLQDSTLAEDDVDYWAGISDSTYAEPAYEPGSFPFEGAYWDSTRSYLAEILENHRDARVYGRAENLYEVLLPPAIENTETDSLGTVDIIENNEIELQTIDDLITECTTLGLNIGTEGGLDGFLAQVEFPDWTQNLSMKGEVAYELTITEAGKISDYRQIGSMDRSGIPQAIEQALEEFFYFYPHELDAPLSCRFTFPIDL